MRTFNVAACADVHCHCLPGLDDGPQTLADAIALCRTLADDGITAVVASPHQMGRYDGRNSPAEIRQAVADLTAALRIEKILLNIHPGADVRIDERLGDLLDRDQISTIADLGKYLLLELPHDTMIDPLEVIAALRSRGVTPIITHPERHPFLGPKSDLGIPWIEAGAVFQVTAGSLTGGFGPVVEQSAWSWIEQGLVQIIATDSHDSQRRPPMMTAAIQQITARLSHVTARRICLENPLRVLRGESLSPARPRARNPRGGNR